MSSITSVRVASLLLAALLGLCGLAASQTVGWNVNTGGLLDSANQLLAPAVRHVSETGQQIHQAGQNVAHAMAPSVVARSRRDAPVPAPAQAPQVQPTIEEGGLSPVKKSLRSSVSSLKAGVLRSRRQVTYANQQQPTEASTGNLLNYLSQAKAISSLFDKEPHAAASTSGSSSLPFGLGSGSAQSSQQTSSGMNVAQMLQQLGELIRATQERNARMLESTQQGLESAGHQSAMAAKSAQGGIQSALGEIGTGLQRLASNNPNLLPDIRSLYQSVSSKLSSASSSVAAAAQGNTPQQQQVANALSGALRQ